MTDAYGRALPLENAIEPDGWQIDSKEILLPALALRHTPENPAACCRAAEEDVRAAKRVAYRIFRVESSCRGLRRTATACSSTLRKQFVKAVSLTAADFAFFGCSGARFASR